MVCSTAHAVIIDIELTFMPANSSGASNKLRRAHPYLIVSMQIPYAKQSDPSFDSYKVKQIRTKHFKYMNISQRA